MDYMVEAVPAEGYEFDHWEEWYRRSNSPDDFKKTFLVITSPLFWLQLGTSVNGTKIKSPLSYLVAHFKPIGPVYDDPEPDQPEEFETYPPVSDYDDVNYNTGDHLISDTNSRPTIDGILAQAERLVEMIKEFKGE